jgi:hypothetical protein
MEWSGFPFSGVFMFFFPYSELLPGIVIIDVRISPVSNDTRSPICTIACFEVLGCAVCGEILCQETQNT